MSYSIFSEDRPMDLTPTSTPALKNPMRSENATVQYMRDVTLLVISQIAWYRELCPRTEFKQKVLLSRNFNILHRSDDPVVKYLMQNMSGAFDAMHRRYLKSLTMNIKDETGKFLLESYTVTYMYSCGMNESPMSLGISSGHSSVSSTTGQLTPVTQLYSRTLDLLLKLDETNALIKPLPGQSLMDFRLSYYEHTPRNYIPTGFRCYKEEELRNTDLFQETPLKLRQGRIENEFGALGISTKFTRSLLQQLQEQS